MTKTILITGASTGIGRATAELFADERWNVVATMRRPDDGADLAERGNVLVTRLDVTEHASVDQAVEATLARFGPIDALVNNAGYGAYGPLEAVPMAAVERQFATNVTGLIATTKAVLPHLRAQGSGVIVNISSVGGRVTFPLGSLYHGTKWAVEGLTESLGFELAPAGIRVKLVEPGGVETDFSGRSLDVHNDESLTVYQPIVAALVNQMRSTLTRSPASLVAKVIHDAVLDESPRLRYLAGADAEAAVARRDEIGDEAFVAEMRQRFAL
ncbi:SDR family oxidoreductase [Micromonospora sp. MS34]|uniref:SDR family oxidoreductase n=1 Tax=Micromonospora sp. MS34 TaxID=3385971 RepID=UPI0039A2AF51